MQHQHTRLQTNFGSSNTGPPSSSYSTNLSPNPISIQFSQQPLPEVLKWDAYRVGQWLTENQFDHHRDSFVRNQITGNTLVELNYTILKELGVTIVGERARILQLIRKQLFTNTGSSASPYSRATSASSPLATDLPRPLPSSSTSSSYSSSSMIPNRTPLMTQNLTIGSASYSSSVPSAIPSPSGSIGHGTGHTSPMTPVSAADKPLPRPKRGGSLSFADIPTTNASSSRPRNIVSTNLGNDTGPEIYSPVEEDHRQRMSSPVGSSNSSRSGSFLVNSLLENANLIPEAGHSNISSAGNSGSSSPLLYGRHIHREPPLHRPLRPNRMTPLQIAPRSSSMKTASVEVPSVESDEDGSTSPLSPMQHSAFSSSPSTPYIDNMRDNQPDRDIMDIQGIRERCIRVHGNNNQSHIIKVAGMNEAKRIREKIMMKFGILDSREREQYGLFVAEPNSRDQFYQLDDENLLQITKSDNEYRSQIFLRRKAAQWSTPSPREIHSQTDARSRQKLKQFFGNHAPAASREMLLSPRSPSHHTSHADSIPMSSASNRLTSPVNLNGPARSTSLQPRPKSTMPKAARQSKRISKLQSSNVFGERPTDEMIVDQLEQFFPGIDKHDDNPNARLSRQSIKSIVQAAVISKRQSRRASAFLSRRYSRFSILANNRASGIITNGAPDGIDKRVTIDARLSNRSNVLAEESEPADSVSSTRPFSENASSSIPYLSKVTMGLGDVSIEPSSIKSELEKQINAAFDDITQPESAISKKEIAPIIRWEQGQLIGSGAFGRVFHALNLDNGEIMAVKQVVLGPENNPQKTKREDSLRREIELLKDLDHENIVRYLGFEITDKAFNVFLEYVSGGSIASCLIKCGRFTEEISQIFTGQILCGLEYLHTRNIIHRDIKGANILIDHDGIAKISDFGISKKNEYMAYQRMTRMSMQGSIPWMAPEVARGKGYSAKVDIWSLGCLVLEMLSGKPPWNNVPGNLIYLLGSGKTPPIPDDASVVSKAFLTAALTTDPEKRPTASELLNHQFTDVDPDAIDFKTWYTAAVAARDASGGTMLTDFDDDDDEDDEDDEDFDEDEYDDNYDQGRGSETRLQDEDYDDEDVPLVEERRPSHQDSGSVKTSSDPLGDLLSLN